MNEISKFICDQLSVWPLAAANFRALKSVRTKTLDCCGLELTVQHNPCRIASSTADTSPETLAARPCFLCAKNRPKEQFHLKFDGRKGRRYNIQINPYPIFPDHLVIAAEKHGPQTIWHHFVDMLDFARHYHDYTIFYNGPFSGASAPDHLHFQACPRRLMPLENAVDKFLADPGNPIETVKDASLYHYEGYLRGVYALKAQTPKSMAKLFYRLLDCAQMLPGDYEPRFNLYTWYQKGEYRSCVVLRSEVRSHHYFAEGSEHLAMSPGAADMAGVLIAPLEEDFEKVDAKMIAEMLDEVTISAEADRQVRWRLTRTQQTIEVGIMTAPEINFEIISDGAGPQRVRWADGRIDYNGVLYDELYFDAVTMSTLFAEPSFILRDVPVGKGFHWEHSEDLKFAGSLKFIVEGDKITAVNRVGLEDYLLSVVSSEMKSTAGLELLKAHAVISRSWVLRNLHSHGSYDVCADDHCQRYHGCTRIAGDAVRQAIDETWGEVLRFGGEICDARYSKCCGGRTELFSTCWEDRYYPYLQPVEDAPEAGADPFCDCRDEAVLSQVLNDFDCSTKDFFRWTQRYSREEVSGLVARKTGIDFGTVQDFEAVERGPSGRIKYLRVTGDKRSEVIGKELAIRNALSETHLKSSAFDISWEGDTLVLSGKGWGHGVGLCQIGAAVMASRGYGYRQILQHYYPGTEVSAV